jgi:uncharacterized protein (DUF1778 family)
MTVNDISHDQTRFILDDEHWAEFIKVLRHPVKPNPRLRKLLTEPSVLEKQSDENSSRQRKRL